MSAIGVNPTSSWPLVIPAGWWKCPEKDGLKMIMTQTASGLRASFSIEHWPGPDRDNLGPMEQAGTFRRLVLSRKTMYPTWDEMRDFIRACGLFDRSRDVVMVVPPDREYVNLHPNAFHWWQRVE
jgi:hypothetical protein